MIGPPLKKTQNLAFCIGNFDGINNKKEWQWHETHFYYSLFFSICLIIISVLSMAIKVQRHSDLSSHLFIMACIWTTSVIAWEIYATRISSNCLCSLITVHSGYSYYRGGGGIPIGAYLPPNMNIKIFL